MKTLLKLSFVCLLGMFLTAHSGLAQTAFAKVTPTRGGEFKITNINKSMVKKNLGKGYMVTKIDVALIDSLFYLERHIVTPDGKKLTAYTSLRRAGNHLFPIPEIRRVVKWICWQIASCQCERPEREGSCRCQGGGYGDSGCAHFDDRAVSIIVYETIWE